MNHLDLVALLTILRDNGVYHYKTTELELELQPLIKPEPMMNKMTREELEEELLYHSA